MIASFWRHCGFTQLEFRETVLWRDCDIIAKVWVCSYNAAMSEIESKEEIMMAKENESMTVEVAAWLKMIDIPESFCSIMKSKF